MSHYYGIMALLIHSSNFMNQSNKQAVLLGGCVSVTLWITSFTIRLQLSWTVFISDISRCLVQTVNCVSVSVRTYSAGTAIKCIIFCPWHQCGKQVKIIRHVFTKCTHWHSQALSDHRVCAAHLRPQTLFEFKQAISQPFYNVILTVDPLKDLNSA